MQQAGSTQLQASGLLEDIWNVTLQTQPDIPVGDGRFGFTVHGRIGQGVVVEGSANLVGWNGLRTNPLSGETIFSNDPASGKSRVQLYRIWLH